MFVKPVKGRSVPDPARGDLLPAEGRNVDENNYCCAVKQRVISGA